MRIFEDLGQLDPPTRDRYSRIVAKLEGEYLFDDERKKLFRELEAINHEASVAAAAPKMRARR